MPHQTFHAAPAKLIEGDPLGLHDPLTFGDLVRIETVLNEGSVVGAEADRLRAIHQDAVSELQDALKPARDAVASYVTRVMPKIDFPTLLGATEKANVMNLCQSFKPALDFSNFSSKMDVGKLLRPIDLPDYEPLAALRDFETPELDYALLDTRPAHMEDLAEKQLQALTNACSKLEAVAHAIAESDERADRRHFEAKAMNRGQTKVVVAVTIAASLLSACGGAALAHILG